MHTMRGLQFNKSVQFAHRPAVSQRTGPVVRDVSVHAAPGKKGNRGKGEAKLNAPKVAVMDNTAATGKDTSSGPAPAKAPKGNREVIVTADSISKTHDGERTLFRDLNFTIARGDRMSIIGPNGSGKTTLMKILAGIDNPTVGSVVRKKALNVGYLAQDPELPEEATILEAALSESSSSVAKVAREYEEALQAIERGEEGAEDRLTKAMGKMDSAGAWDLSSEAHSLLEDLGLPDVNMRIKELSGGQRRRVSIAAALLSRPDLLMLDEPTNHLDANTIQTLQKRLTASNDAAVVLVTHDRSFMEEVCTRILEIDEASGAYLHSVGGRGSYQAFLELREQRRIAQRGEAERALTLLRTEEVWMRKQPKARQAKSKAREQRYFELVDRSKTLPKEAFKVDMNTIANGMNRLGAKVLDIEDASAGWNGRTLFSKFNYEFERGERLAIVGPNGAGKSTLLDVITGNLESPTGSRVVGETTRMGYFTQVPPPVPSDMKMIDYIANFVSADGPSGAELLRQQEANEIKALSTSRQERQAAALSAGGGTPSSTQRASAWAATAEPEKVLERLGFPRARQHQRVGKLSGGERRRLHLATILISKPNLLILDEPTNDLDLNTIEALEEFLTDYPGTLITVSHDRSFLENVADRLLVLKGDGLVRYYNGTYEDYLEDLADEMAEAANGTKSPTPAAAAAPPKPAAEPVEQPETVLSSYASVGSSMDAPASSGPKKPLSDFEKRELARLEAEIEKMTKERNTLEAKLLEASASGDKSAISKTTFNLQKVTGNLEKSEAKWMALADRL